MVSWLLIVYLAGLTQPPTVIKDLDSQKACLVLVKEMATNLHKPLDYDCLSVPVSAGTTVVGKKSDNLIVIGKKSDKESPGNGHAF